MSFPELVWRHHAWAQDFHADGHDRRLEAEYRGALEAFEQKHGEVADAYWSTTCASAVALTVKPRTLLERALGINALIEFHRESDWVTTHAPRTAEALQRCERLAIRVGEVLRGTPEHIAMRSVHAVASHLLGLVDRTKGEPDPRVEERFARAQEAELGQIEDYYERAGNNAGRLLYFSGMIIGLLAIVPLGGFLLWLLRELDVAETTLKTFFACYAAGTVGAIVSVMSRMSSGDKFAVDFEVGRTALRWLGSFRPVLGAVFGVAMYFLIQSGILMTEPPDGEARFFYFGILAFVGGFSERTTKIIPHGVENLFPELVSASHRSFDDLHVPPQWPAKGAERSV